MKDKKLRKVFMTTAVICTLILLGAFGSYAFFTITASNKNEEVNVQTGTLALTFADGNDAIAESLEFGGSVEKTFTIENTGTLDAWAKINFEDLVNTYLDGSLTFTLSYSDSENGEFTDLITNKNVPRSETSSTKEIIDSLSIPAGVKYFYKLAITLNYLDEVDQTSDLNAIFSTHFKLEQGSAKYTITFDDGSGENTIKEVIENATYGELPTLTKVGHSFVGWFTEPNGQGTEITSATTVNLKSSQTLYAYFKEIFTQSLIAKANKASITSYASGVKGEMYTFTHPATSQTPALTDYRYIGNVPNNYITFNDETWRIIGVFSVQNETGNYEQRIKIIRDETLGKFPWDRKSDKTYTNEWPTSTLGIMLNGDYVNSGGNFQYVWYNSSGVGTSTPVKGLNANAKRQIALSKWYLGGINTHKGLSAQTCYSFERGNAVSSGRSTNTIKYVGLMYPSDYIYTYSNGINETCFQSGYDCEENDAVNSWLFSGYHEWLLNPNSSSSSMIFKRFPTGYINNGTDGYGINTDLRPVVYLRSDIEISSGDGTSVRPYTLKVPEN